MRAIAYFRPRAIDQAIAAVAGDPKAAYYAGGTGLIDLMKLGLDGRETLVDVTHLGLDAVEVGDGAIRIGATAKMSDVAADGRLGRAAPALTQSLASSASQQLRNMATVGGNLLQRTRCMYFRDASFHACNKRAPGSGCAALGGFNRQHAVLGTSDACIAAYPSDWGVALGAFDAAVELRGPGARTRSVPLSEFYRLPGETPHIETTVRPDELMTAITVARTPALARSRYLKVRDRRSYEFAVVSVTAGLTLDGGVVREARLSLGGLATVPWRVPAAERVLVGQALDERGARAAADAALEGARPCGHNAFKIELAKASIVEALLTAGEA